MKNKLTKVFENKKFWKAVNKLDELNAKADKQFKKQIKERAKKIANWIQIEREINDIGNLIRLPKEYECKTIKDRITIQEVERIISEPEPIKKIKPGDHK